jgi:hypothetical protein
MRQRESGNASCIRKKIQTAKNRKILLISWQRLDNEESDSYFSSLRLEKISILDNGSFLIGCTAEKNARKNYFSSSVKKGCIILEEPNEIRKTRSAFFI